MHYAHVKHKEYPMNRYIMEEFHNDPVLRRRLFSEAHRERARAVSAGLAWLFGYLKARLTRHSNPRPAQWLARLG